MKPKNTKTSFAAGYTLSAKRQLGKYAPLFFYPTLFAFIIGFVFPFLWGLYLSFFRFKTLGALSFAGFGNYALALSDASFLRSFGFTSLFTVVSVILINFIAFFIALALTKRIRGGSVFRTVFFMPNLIGGIVLGYIWKLILNGLIIKYLDSTLMLNAAYGFIGLVILVAWQQIGYMMIIYIAGLQNVPTQLNEAALIDGATPFQTLRFVTVPSVMPSITICTFLTLTNSFKLFDQNLALTAGEPAHKTEMLALNIYKSFYESTTNMGTGQAKAVIFFIAVVVIALSQLYFTKRRETVL